MKFTLATSLVATVAASSSVDTMFAEFKAKHSVSYRSTFEHNRRATIFAANVKENSRKNAILRSKGKDEIHGITKFSDLEQAEFASMYLGGNWEAKDFPELTKFDGNFPVRATPEGAYNLADDNLVTAVKDQAQCGSCWAFSATETIESAWAMAGNPITEFSPQQIVSCDVGNGDYGCSGGMPSTAFEYVISAGGMATEEAYPYTSLTGVTGDCTSPLPELTGGTVTTWAYAQDPCIGSAAACVEDSEAIASAIKSFGGISIAVDASSFNSYQGGVMTADSCHSEPNFLDHAIQIIGWDTTGDTPYWIVRNSWAEGWGESGLVRMEMGTNTCGLANYAAMVTAL
ncbi:hypothetical protein ScalyP_jg4996 [Parmales sp. scaly parma]|nr:hypothetical protein ScalyP_jg4996 [Parmales sp. scaly parma]